MFLVWGFVVLLFHVGLYRAPRLVHMGLAFVLAVVRVLSCSARAGCGTQYAATHRALGLLPASNELRLQFV